MPLMPKKYPAKAGFVIFFVAREGIEPPTS